VNVDVILYLSPYIISASISLWLGFFALKRHSVAGANSLAVLAFFETVWTVGYIFQLIFLDLPDKIFWNNVQFLGAVGVPLAYLGFVLAYDRPAETFLARLSWKPFVPFALILLGMIWTDDLHHLFRGSPGIEPAFPSGKLVFQDGLLFPVFTVYMYGFLLLSIGIMGYRYFHAERLYRLQIGFVFIGILIPLAASSITYFPEVSFRLHEITPISFGVSDLIIAWTLFRYHLFEMVPVARNFLIESMPEGVLVLDQELRILDINPAAHRILTHNGADPLGKKVTSFPLFHPEWFTGLFRGESRRQEIILGSGSTARYFEIQVTLLNYPKGDVSVFLVILRDINEQKRTEMRLHELAITDSLTGIFNRRHVISCAEHEVEQSYLKGSCLSMIVMDIDHFKRVNDTFGHLVGDRVLEQLVQCCQSNFRSSDIIGRYGGEEFLVVLPDTDQQTAYQIADRVREHVAALKVPGYEDHLQVTISQGVSSTADQGQVTVDKLLEQADAALYQAKKAHRNCICVYRRENSPLADGSR
jgi:diguanylate cyclase (GGDEF)-like protein/PAS domain S-box-containing protein